METEKKKIRLSLRDGLVKQNMVLMSALLIAPIVAAATTLKSALVIVVAFSLISFVSIFISGFIPHKIVYTLRIIIYALIATVIYMPSYMLVHQLFPDETVMCGVYLMVIVANPLILSKTESRFFLRPMGMMMIDVLMFIIGFDAVCIIVGIIREFFVFNEIGGIAVNFPFTVPALETAFGGFLIVGILSGIFRAVHTSHRKRTSHDNNREAAI